MELGGPGTARVTALAPDPRQAGVLWAAGAQGVYRSDDRGARWTRVSGEGFQPFPPFGPVADRVLLVAGSSTSSRTLRAASSSDLASSADFGQTWSLSAVSGAGTSVLGARERLRIDPRTPSRFYAVSAGTLFVSEDGGDTWRAPSRFGLNDIAFDPARAGFLWGAAEGGLFLSKDHGATWTLVSSPLNGVRAATFSNRAAVTEAGYGLWRSTDRGRTWSPTLPGNVQGFTYRLCDDLTADPADPRRIFAGCFLIDLTGGQVRHLGRELWRSGDGGVSWTAVWDVASVAYDAAHPGIAYGGTAGEILRSLDGGATWEPAGGGLGRLFLPAIDGLWSDSAHPGRLYLAAGGAFFVADFPR